MHAFFVCLAVACLFAILRVRLCVVACISAFADNTYSNTFHAFLGELVRIQIR